MRFMPMAMPMGMAVTTARKNELKTRYRLARICSCRAFSLKPSHSATTSTRVPTNTRKRSI
jgi:hypothetical protein